MNYIKYSPVFDELTTEEQILLNETVSSVKAAVGYSSAINGHKTRNFHAKAHAGIRGKFILADLPEDFKTICPFPESCEVLARFSNAETQIQDDRKSMPAYGFALKMTNDSGFEANFPMVNFPVFPSNSVSDILKLVMAVNERMLKTEKQEPTAGATWDVVKEFTALAAHSGLLPMLNVLKKGITMKKDFILNCTYHTIGCFRFGDAVMKLRLVPIKSFSIENPEDIVQQFMAKTVLNREPVNFDLEVQIAEDENSQPVNDLLKEWPTDKFVKLGSIVFPEQQIIRSDDPELEKLSFSPFINPQELLPVGKIQQTRHKIYDASFEARTSV